MSDVAEWKQTACILCSINCGVEVRLDGRRFARVRGDKAHPGSRGYTCEKALRLDHYQNGQDRLTTPLRRRPEGGFEPVSWDTAIAEVAVGLAKVRDEHGGASIFYYGGGGQGNHLVGAYGAATRRTLGSRYTSNALAQEKTGEFWVDGQLFGSTSCHTTGDWEDAQTLLFVGKNPWQSHGFPRARVILKEVAKDPERQLIVIDPRRTETADLADHFLQVRPGGDAWLLSALLATLLQEDLVDRAYLEAHTEGFVELAALVGGIDVAEYAARAGVAEDQVRTVARVLARSASVSIYEDLGIQMAPHSTLNSWLEKLAYLLTGNFAVHGGMNLHTRMANLGGGRGSAATSPVGGHRIISGLVPCNAVPGEILTDHPDRYRAMIVESANPAHSLADSGQWRAALDALDFVVVIDVALTETARHAHYVLPAASQYEKPEATFFNLEFPRNVFQLRRPLLDPVEDTLSEAAIHARLCQALGAVSEDDLAPLRAAAEAGRAAFAEAFFAAISAKPALGLASAVVLFETLGRTLPPGLAEAAVLWGAAHQCAQKYPDSVRRAGIAGDGLELGENLFQAILDSPSGLTFTVDEPEMTWARLSHADGKVHLVVEELVDELRSLAATRPAADDEFPVVLSAGERRSSTANTIVRDPAFRREQVAGALRVSPADAERYRLVDGGRARITTRAGTAVAVVEVNDTMQDGHVSLPNGFGLSYPEGEGAAVTGVAVNELTTIANQDWLAGTPLHKHVPARLEPATT